MDPDLSRRAEQAVVDVVAAMAASLATPRHNQLAAVRALIAGSHRVLVVQSTGWSMSAVY